MQARNDELEELVNSFDDWVRPELVHDEDRPWRVRSVLLAMISTEQGIRARETRRTPGLGVSEPTPMPRICLSSASSRLACVATYDLRKAANMVSARVEILVKTSYEGHVGLDRERSWPISV